MISRFREYRSARALHRALERYERLVAQGSDEGAARAKISDQLGADSAIFALAARLHMSAAQMPEPDPRSVEAFARRLRAEPVPEQPSRLAALQRLAIPRPRFQFAPLAAAAAVAVFAVFLIPALNSLPGDALYGLKTASENTRVLISSGPSEARVRLGLAEERFEEVDDLLERAANQQAFAGAGTYAAAVGDIDDPELVKLVAETLSRAGEQIVAAAQILIATPTATATDLAQLVAISRQGQQVAETAALQLPTVEPPARNTVTTLARVEAQAEAVRKLGAPVTTPEPCPTATPTPIPTATPTTSPTPTPSLDSTPAPIPTASPAPTPCVSPTPSPTPTPVPTAPPEATPVPPVETQAPTAEGEPSEDGNSDDQASVQSAEQGSAGIPAG
jgi:hypothetical protein